MESQCPDSLNLIMLYLKHACSPCLNYAERPLKGGQKPLYMLHYNIKNVNELFIVFRVHFEEEAN